jgi:hypothetical protein
VPSVLAATYDWLSNKAKALFGPATKASPLSKPAAGAISIGAVIIIAGGYSSGLMVPAPAHVETLDGTATPIEAMPGLTPHAAANSKEVQPETISKEVQPDTSESVFLTAPPKGQVALAQSSANLLPQQHCDALPVTTQFWMPPASATAASLASCDLRTFDVKDPFLRAGPMLLASNDDAFFLALDVETHDRLVATLSQCGRWPGSHFALASVLDVVADEQEAPAAHARQWYAVQAFHPPAPARFAGPLAQCLQHQLSTLTAGLAFPTSRDCLSLLVSID